MKDDIKRIMYVASDLSFRCSNCTCKSQVTQMYLLTPESVKNDVTKGDAFIKCPLCRAKKYFWIEEE